MVQASTKNGFVNLESLLQITEGQKCAIIRNPDKVKNMLKEMHAEHTIAANEDGTLISKFRRNVEGSFNPCMEAKRIDGDHKSFLKIIDQWLEDKIEEPEAQAAITKPASEKAPEEDDDEPMMVLLAIPVMIV